MSTSPLLGMLEGYLNLVGERQQLVVANMANADTPGYHTRDLNFQSAMQQVINSGGAPTMQPTALQLTDLPERPDGNNVNIDREGMLLSQMQLQYQMGVQLIKERFHELLTAIQEP